MKWAFQPTYALYRPGRSAFWPLRIRSVLTPTPAHMARLYTLTFMVICFLVRSARFQAAAFVTRRTCLPHSRSAVLATLSRTFLSTDSSWRVSLANDALSTVAAM